jgi:hypothetical protein
MTEEDEVERRARAIVEARNAEGLRRAQRLEARESEYQLLIDSIFSAASEKTRVPFYFDGDTNFITYCSKDGKLRRVRLISVWKGHAESDEDFEESGDGEEPFDYSISTFLDGDDGTPIVEEWCKSPEKIRELATEGIVDALADLVANDHHILEHQTDEAAAALERAKSSVSPPPAGASPSKNSSGGCVGLLFVMGLAGLIAWLSNLIN